MTLSPQVLPKGPETCLRCTEIILVNIVQARMGWQIQRKCGCEERKSRYFHSKSSARLARKTGRVS